MNDRDKVQAAQNRPVVVGVFSDRLAADRAVEDLRGSGFRNDQVGVVTRRADGTTTLGEAGETNWEEGAAVGALAGASAGGLIGLGVLAGVIPVIGPVIAGGTLAVILANAAGGAVIGGLIGSLIGLGIPEEEARYYEDEVKAGRTVVTVKAEDRAGIALGIMQRHGAHDYHTRPAQAGTVVRAPAGHGTPHITARPIGGAAGMGEAQNIQVREEVLTPRKEEHVAGEVRVRKDVVTEQRTINVPVQREEIVIERSAPAGGTHATSASIQPGEEIRIPVKEEKVTIDKQTVVKEEVKIGKRQVQENQAVSGTVRKEEVRVEETGDVNVTDSRDKGRKTRDRK